MIKAPRKLCETQCIICSYCCCCCFFLIVLTIYATYNVISHVKYVCTLILVLSKVCVQGTICCFLLFLDFVLSWYVDKWFWDCFSCPQLLTLILLMWRIWWASNNSSRWQMGFNSVFKGLMLSFCFHIPHAVIFYCMVRIF